MAQNVKITVRCAVRSATDIPVDCPRSWTIRDLKEHLREVCSLHPTVASQRLIYAGACLSDQMTIESVLARRKFDDQLVFHLVCPLPYIAPELRQRSNPVTTQRNYNSLSPESFGPMSSPGADFSSPEYVQAYQAYYSWYMNSYMSMITSAYRSPVFRTPEEMLNTPPMVNNAPAWANANVMNEAQPAGPPAAPQENDAAPRPANFVQGEELEARGGDILDLLYRCFRILLFVSVVWLYSSIERFLVVFCIGLCIYFLKLRRDQRAAAAAANPAPLLINNNNAGEPTANAEGVIDHEVEQPNSRQLFLATCYSFITSFFTSLVPDNPMPANLN